MPSAVVKLIIERASQTMSDGGIRLAIENLSSDEKLKRHMAAAKEWVATAIAAVKADPGGAAMGDDEKIAQTILDGITEKRKARKAG